MLFINGTVLLPAGSTNVPHCFVPPLARRRLGVVSYHLIEIPQFEVFLCYALGQFSNQPRRLACDNREVGYHHVRGYDRPIQDFDVVFDDSKLSNGTPAADLDVIPNTTRLHDAPLAHEDVVSQARGHVGEGALVHPTWRADNGAASEKAVAPHGHGRALG